VNAGRVVGGVLGVRLAGVLVRHRQEWNLRVCRVRRSSSCRSLRPT
jgi:hypothetical protein